MTQYTAPSIQYEATQQRAIRDVHGGLRNPVDSGERQPVNQASTEPSTDLPVPSWRSQSFREVQGRQLNAGSDVYSLPADAEEAQRLDKLHRIFYNLSLSNHYYDLSQVVEEVLEPTEDRQRTVLDLGCGSGAWAIQCATDFPHADVLGIDLAPSCLGVPPSNCRFEIHDINGGLERFLGSAFDLIHVRLVNTGVKDYKRLVDQASHCLRPGGLVVFLELDYHSWSEDKRILVTPNFYTPLPSENSQSGDGGAEGTSTHNDSQNLTRSVHWALPSHITLIRKCAEAKGGDISSARCLGAWLKAHPAYSPIETRDLWMPCGAWKPTIKDEWTTHPNFPITGELVVDHFVAFSRSARPLLLGYFPEQEIMELEGRAVQEVKDGLNPVYVCIRAAAARKI